MDVHRDAYQLAVVGTYYGRRTFATWECRRYSNIHDEKCDAYPLYCFDVFRENAYWDAPSQWRLDSARPGRLAGWGRKRAVTMIIVSLTAPVTRPPRTYTWLPKMSCVGFTKIDIKAYFLNYFSFINSIKNNWYIAHFPDTNLYFCFYISLLFLSKKSCNNTF